MMWEMRRGRFDFFNLKNPFIIYYLIQLPISGLVTVSTGVPSEIGLEPVTYSETYNEAFAVSAIGLLLFQFGYYIQSVRGVKIPLLLRRPWVGNRYQWIVIVFIGLGVSAFFALLEINGGIVEFLANREVFRAGGLIGQGIMMFPATSLLSLAALIYFIGNIQSSATSRGIVRSIFMLMFILIPPFVIGFRNLLFLPVLQFMVLWNYIYRKIKGKNIIISLIMIGTCFTLYGISREVPQNEIMSPSLLVDIIQNKPELAFSIVSRSKGIEVVAMVIDTLDQTGDYELGWRSFIETTTIVIPRTLWKDKPQASSERFTTYFFAQALQLSRGFVSDVWGGISPTVVGELYWHFGWFGVAVGLYILGSLAKVVYSTLQRNLTSSSVVIIYSIIYTYFAMMAEAIQGYVNGLVMYGFVIVVTLVLLTMRKFSK